MNSPGQIAGLSAQSVYTLPGDHRFHGGGIYDTGYLEEWHYWTGFFTDDETGEELGLFYNIFREGVKPGVVGHRVMSSLGNFKTKEFVWVAKLLAELVADVSADTNSPEDFCYTFGDPNAGEYARTTYHAATDTWSIQFQSVASSPAIPYKLDLKLVTKTPYGYLNVTPTGMEPQNAPWTGKFDPQTMSSISYYYSAPKMAATGTITTGERTRKITGSMWFEHQWGNFSFGKVPSATAYIWSAFQFNDGSIFTFRQWLDPHGKPLLDLGRHSYSKPDGTTNYGFGASVVWEGLKTWTSPVSGNVFPTSGRVTSPYGTFYYTGIFSPYEMPLGFPPYGDSHMTLFEGPVWIRQDSLEGPIIGRAFLELPVGLTRTFPEMP